VIHQLVGGLKAAMGYTGCATVDEMRTNAASCASPARG
jgi:IMP dehydrogenase